jgi:hypothetical protein
MPSRTERRALRKMKEARKNENNIGLEDRPQKDKQKVLEPTEVFLTRPAIML